MKKEVVLNIESNTIKYFEFETLLSDFHMDDVLAIGEVTTDQGPFGDDHFIMFITVDKIWNRIPTDANGFAELIEYVGSKLNVDSFVQLANRSDFKSRIIYPKSLEGKDFLKLEPITPNNWFDKMGIWLGIKDRFKMVALSEVHDNLKSRMTE